MFFWEKQALIKTASQMLERMGSARGRGRPGGDAGQGQVSTSGRCRPLALPLAFPLAPPTRSPTRSPTCSPTRSPARSPRSLSQVASLPYPTDPTRIRPDHDRPDHDPTRPDHDPTRQSQSKDTLGGKASLVPPLEKRHVCQSCVRISDPNKCRPTRPDQMATTSHV